MTAWEKQYFWKPSPKVMAEICQRCHICPKQNPEIPIHTSHRHFPLLLGHFEIWQVDFTSLSPFQGCKYVLMIVCMYSHWVEAFPWRWVTPLTVAKTLLKRIIPTEGIPLEWHSDNGAHFIVQILHAICKIQPLLHFHCNYHPQSSSPVERNKAVIKTQLAKLSEAIGLPWPKFPYIVLLNLISIPFGKYKLSLFEKKLLKNPWFLT